jgi:type VI secretion system protein ImpI
MSEIEQPTLLFKVTNVQLLESGLTPQKRFDSSGGTIGSGRHNDWLLLDAKGEIRSIHCEVLMIDGAFCLKDTSGETYVNGAFMPMGRGRLAKLQHKDEIQIGPYQLRLSLMNKSEEQIEATQLDKMFDSVGDDLISGDFDGDDAEVERDANQNADPLMALDALMKDDAGQRSFIDDEVEIQDEASDFGVNSSSTWKKMKSSFSTPESDGEGQMTSSMSLKRILGFGVSKPQQDTTAKPEDDFGIEPINKTVSIDTHNQSEGFDMDDNVLDLLEEEVAKSMESTPTNTATPKTRNNHLLTGPMLNGLGVDFLDHYDAGQMHALSQELGESLQACIKGILDLHQQVSEGRFGVMTRHLQPIEDNPLRLGLDYKETLRTMYDSNKSMVHLSAPVAIEESLKHIRDHNDAVQQATSEALTQILAAFSPHVLMRRFNNYKRSTDGSSESNEAWAWKMYCSYYQELTSNRQKGFEKLFWEIFEQAYDKKIREKQLEF